MSEGHYRTVTSVIGDGLQGHPVPLFRRPEKRQQEGQGEKPHERFVEVDPEITRDVPVAEAGEPMEVQSGPQ
jgi:hypothetical protein